MLLCAFYIKLHFRPKILTLNTFMTDSLLIKLFGKIQIQHYIIPKTVSLIMEIGYLRHR